jgi:hypothetical protein
MLIILHRQVPGGSQNQPVLPQIVSIERYGYCYIAPEIGTSREVRGDQNTYNRTAGSRIHSVPGAMRLRKFSNASQLPSHKFVPCGSSEAGQESDQDSCQSFSSSGLLLFLRGMEGRFDCAEDRRGPPRHCTAFGDLNPCPLQIDRDRPP